MKKASKTHTHKNKAEIMPHEIAAGITTFALPGAPHGAFEGLDGKSTFGEANGFKGQQGSRS